MIAMPRKYSTIVIACCLGGLLVGCSSERVYVDSFEQPQQVRYVRKGFWGFGKEAYNFSVKDDANVDGQVLQVPADVESTHYRRYAKGIEKIGWHDEQMQWYKEHETSIRPPKKDFRGYIFLQSLKYQQRVTFSINEHLDNGVIVPALNHTWLEARLMEQD